MQAQMRTHQIRSADHGVKQKRVATLQLSEVTCTSLVVVLGQFRSSGCLVYPHSGVRQTVLCLQQRETAPSITSTENRSAPPPAH